MSSRLGLFCLFVCCFFWREYFVCFNDLIAQRWRSSVVSSGVAVLLKFFL